ncbi:amino acid ABC transporter permease [Oceanobacillus sp. Castelsardo]|uniref:amino acid ABC transporter permease n=1 Tax=Oceanobacillus sp. Castelsardo TaxID=1851204 RepID=UPI000AD909CD|nr:ABC transporter permease subunit [Oceanobacillus sp. Castelsardo]
MMFQLDVLIENLFGILKVVPQTLLLAVIILILSLFMGGCLALIQRKKIPIISSLISVMQSFLRGTPNVVLLYLGYYTLPYIVQYIVSLVGIDFNPHHLHPVITVIVVFSISFSVFQSETIRGSMHSVDHGQIEAAHSLGYSFFQTLRKVVVPQALVEALPDIMNSFLVIIKVLSLAYLISVVDIFGQAKLLGAYNFSYIEAFVAAALVYWALCSFLTLLINKFELRLRKGF